jgi:WD40 repeat protein
VLSASFSYDSRSFLTTSLRGKVRQWSAANGRLIGGPMLHPDFVLPAVFSPDGKLILTGGARKNEVGEARLWEAGTGKLLGKPLVQPGIIFSVSFSPDGNTFLTVCPQQAQLWDRNGKTIGPPLRPPAAVSDATFSPDGRMIVAGCSDGTVRLWSVSDGKPIGAPLRSKRTNSPVAAVAIHPSGKFLAVAGKDLVLELWNLSTRLPEKRQMPLIGLPHKLAFSPDGRLLASGTIVYTRDAPNGPPRMIGGEARLWNTVPGPRFGAPLGLPLPHPLPVTALAFSPNNELLMTGCEDGITRLFSTTTATPFGNPLPGSGGTVKEVAFSRDGRAAVTARAGQSASLWHLPPPGAMGRTLFPGKSVRCLAFSPDDGFLTAGFSDGSVRLYDLVKDRPDAVLPGHRGEVQQMCWSPAGTLLTRGKDHRVRLWRPPSGKPLLTLVPGGAVAAIDYHAHAPAFAIGQSDGIVRLYDPGGKQIRPPLQTAPLLSSLSLAGPDLRVFTANKQDTARCWDWTLKQVVHEYRHPGPARGVVVSSDGRLVLTLGSTERVGQLHDAASAKRVRPPLLLDGRDPGLVGGAFTQDGRRLALFSSDGVRLSDSSGRPLGPFLRHRLLCAAISDTGRWVAAGNEQGVRLWELPPPMAGSPERIRLEVEAITGLQLDEETILPLSAESIEKRLEQLSKQRTVP